MGRADARGVRECAFARAHDEMGSDIARTGRAVKHLCGRDAQVGKLAFFRISDNLGPKAPGLSPGAEGASRGPVLAPKALKNFRGPVLAPKALKNF